MHRRLVASLCLAVLLACVPLVAFGQTASPSVSILSIDDSQFPQLTLLLKVVDSLGRPVEGLTTDDLAVVEEGKPAEVVSVRDTINLKQSIAIVMVIDVSGSMAGQPLESAKAAAVNFVENLGPADQVAILSFADAVHSVLPFTDDVAAASDAIQGLQAGGATALYDAAYQGVQMAAQADSPERLVILLGDGNESGVSLAKPDDAFEAARANGAPIHTIALGAATEVPYFQQLSGLTGGIALGAPAPDQLASAWEELSELLRRQVELVVHSGVPGDGKSHNLTVQATVGAAKAEDSATFTSHPVVPVLRLLGLAAAETIAAERHVSVEIEAQGATSSVSFRLDGELLKRLDEPPWKVTLTPQTLRAGDHHLEVEAVDESGVAGTLALDFQVAPLPPEVTVALEEGELLAQPRSLTPKIVSQAPAARVEISIDGQLLATHTEPPFRFVLDPEDFESGAHILTVAATDADGQTGQTEIGFSIPAVEVEPGPARAISPLSIGALSLVMLVLVGVLAALVLRRRPVPTEAAPEFYLEVVAGLRTGQQFEVTPEPQLIGRVSTAGIRIPDPTGQLKISREHARVWREGDTAFVEDVGSTHGTVVEGVKIIHKTVLPDGGRIRLGEVELVYHGVPSEADDLRATTLATVEPSDVDAEDARGTQIKPQPSHESDELRQTKEKAGSGDDEDERRTTKRKD